jgi:hypothetical protein
MTIPAAARAVAEKKLRRVGRMIRESLVGSAMGGSYRSKTHWLQKTRNGPKLDNFATFLNIFEKISRLLTTAGESGRNRFKALPLKENQPKKNHSNRDFAAIFHHFSRWGL